MDSSQISTASGSYQSVVEHSTLELTAASTLTVASQSTVSAFSASLAATEMTFGSAPSITTKDASASDSPGYSEEHHSSTRTAAGSTIQSTLSSSFSPYQSHSTGGQVSSIETFSTGVSESSSTTSQILSGAALATGVSDSDTTSLGLGASHTSSTANETASSYKPALYTGVASSVQWSLSLILGSVIVVIMAISL